MNDSETGPPQPPRDDDYQCHCDDDYKDGNDVKKLDFTRRAFIHISNNIDKDNGWIAVIVVLSWFLHSQPKFFADNFIFGGVLTLVTFAFKMYAGYLDNDKDGRDDDDVYYKALWWMKTATPTCFVNKVF